MHTTLKNVELLKHFKIRKLLQHVSVYKETIIRDAMDRNKNTLTPTTDQVSTQIYYFSKLKHSPHTLLYVLSHFPPTQALLHRTAPHTTQARHQARPAPPERVEYLI